jgi:GntR family transcriptional regulator, sialic acid-inducible nan operon repressor
VVSSGQKLVSLSASSRTPKIHEQIGHQLEVMILNGTYQPGDTLPSERQLMEAFGVGRPAVREALLSLERAGIVRLRSGSPAVVTRVSPQKVLSGLALSVRSFMSDEAGIRELQAARKIVECAIARHAALHRTNESLTQIRQALDANAAAIEDLPLFERTDVDFHAEIVRTVGNRIFEATLLALSDWLLEQRQTTLKMPGQRERALAFHVGIFEAIEQGDPDAAEWAMAAHMDQTVDVYWKAIAQ